MKSVTILSALAIILPAFAVPTPEPAPINNQAFSGVAITSAPEIQYMPINANGTNFWLNRTSLTYTPPSVPTFNEQNNTLFTRGDDVLALNVAVPGGQEVYVDNKGRLRFTTPHNSDKVIGSKTTGFSFSQGHLLFENRDFWACDLGAVYENAWMIYVRSGHDDFDVACVEFRFRASASNGTAAFEYL
jgi:hypothetical protein